MPNEAEARLEAAEKVLYRWGPNPLDGTIVVFKAALTELKAAARAAVQTRVEVEGLHDAPHTRSALLMMLEEAALHIRDGSKIDPRVLVTFGRVMRGMTRPRHQRCCALTATEQGAS